MEQEHQEGRGLAEHGNGFGEENSRNRGSDTTSASNRGSEYIVSRLIRDANDESKPASTRQELQGLLEEGVVILPQDNLMSRLIRDANDESKPASNGKSRERGLLTMSSILPSPKVATTPPTRRLVMGGTKRCISRDKKNEKGFLYEIERNVLQKTHFQIEASIRL